MNQPIEIFDRKVRRIHRDRSAKLLTQPGMDFLIDEARERIVEVFDGEILRQFPKALDLGCRHGKLHDLIKGYAGVEEIVQCDISFPMIEANKNTVVVAEEDFLPFAAESFNLVLSVLNLHWINDLPGCLIQINKTLKEDGLFIASMFGESTLCELTDVIRRAEIQDTGGISPRVSPFTMVKDAGSLLQRAGFALPVATSEVITVMYNDVLALMKDLRTMGETNALVKRNKSFTRRSTMIEIAKTYQQMYGNEDGHIPATFEIITLTGWKN